jgi:hypothetical protein
MNDTTAERLVAAGLVGPVFDIAAIEQDVRGRIELDASLNDLIGPDDASKPSEFNPENPS